MTRDIVRRRIQWATASRRWRRRHPEQRKAIEQKWQRKHPEKWKKIGLNWRRKNRKHLRCASARWYQGHKRRTRLNNNRWRTKNRKYVRVRERRRYARDRKKILMQCRQMNATLKSIIIAEYGGKCTCPKCPEKNPAFLTVEHVGGRGCKDRKENRSGAISMRLYRRIIALGFPKTFTIFCWNCNAGSYRSGGICPHMRQKKSRR